MGQSFEQGDKVTWRSHGNTVDGTVEKRLTEDQQAAGRTVRASPQEPQYLVRSDQTGRAAVHRPEALKKRS